MAVLECEAEVWAVTPPDCDLVVPVKRGVTRCAGARALFDAARAGTVAIDEGTWIETVRPGACRAAAFVDTTLAGVLAWCGATA